MQISIKNYKTKALLGVYPHEKEKLTDIEISLIIDFDGTKAAETDDLRYTIDYDKVVEVIEETLKDKDYNLIERMIIEIQQDLKTNFLIIEDLGISIIKRGVINKADYIHLSI
jgi:dihydroneopterin aldolase